MTDRVSFTVKSILNGYVVTASLGEHFCPTMDDVMIYIEREIREMLT
jgi:hypothetical protein